MKKYHDERIKPSKHAIIRWFGFDQFIPLQLVTSYWISSKVFLIIRFFLALYSTVVFWSYFGGLVMMANMSYFFSAFTTLTYIGLHAYLITSFVHHVRYIMHGNVDFILKQPSVLNYMLMYLYGTIVTYNVLTPVVFWAVLAKSSTSLRAPAALWLTVSLHGVSFFLMLLDVILNRMRLPMRLIIVVFCTVVFYMLLTFIIYGSTDTWVYPFLEWSQGPTAAIYYFMVVLIVIAAYLFMILVHYMRDWIARLSNKIDVIVIEDDKGQRHVTEMVRRASNSSFGTAMASFRAPSPPPAT